MANIKTGCLQPVNPYPVQILQGAQKAPYKRSRMALGWLPANIRIALNSLITHSS